MKTVTEDMIRREAFFISLGHFLSEYPESWHSRGNTKEDIDDLFASLEDAFTDGEAYAWLPFEHEELDVLFDYIWNHYEYIFSQFFMLIFGKDAE